MKLYLKQKIFSWSSRFTVRDANGDDKYNIQGELLSWGRKLHVFDKADREVAFIKQKGFSILPRFEVYIEDHFQFEVIKKFTIIRPEYDMVGLDWVIKGELFSHEYKIVGGYGPVATVSKAYFSWGDSYSIDIVNPETEVKVLAAVLAIDCALAIGGTAV
ncbi:MAG: hypothetical protein GX099_04735 [Clostridiaceae bacterium]|jgi:uncharacterized protein YxjI|nr:LURP-one-related family protein [Oscillospiraceae bacterium]NLO62719.1 hypothetical protein [Clostridiaceae bacterium]